jgi:hypothetical protein
VFKGTVLKTFRPKWKDVTKEWQKKNLMSFIICTLHQSYYISDGREMWHIEMFDYNTERKRQLLILKYTGKDNTEMDFFRPTRRANVE